MFTSVTPNGTNTVTGFQWVDQSRVRILTTSGVTYPITKSSASVIHRITLKLRSKHIEVSGFTIDHVTWLPLTLVFWSPETPFLYILNGYLIKYLFSYYVSVLSFI